jgi:hypothetical protein
LPRLPGLQEGTVKAHLFRAVEAVRKESQGDAMSGHLSPVEDIGMAGWDARDRHAERHLWRIALTAGLQVERAKRAAGAIRRGDAGLVRGGDADSANAGVVGVRMLRRRHRDL